MNSSEDFSIELGQSVRRHIEQKKSPREDGRFIALPYDSPENDREPVFISERVMKSIEEHVGREIDKEVGGVLLGGFYRNGKGNHVEITDFIEAKATVGTDVSLTFTHDTWAQINEEQSRRGGDCRIVGWYHSHPGLGVFLSKEDNFIHSSYFSEPWQMALVVDPIYHNWGCFRWNDKELEPTAGFFVFGDRKSAKRVREYVKQTDSTRQAPPRSASASADRRNRGHKATTIALSIAVLILLISQMITGYMLMTRRAKPAKAAEIDYYQRAMEQLSKSDLSGAGYSLRQVLHDPTDKAIAKRKLELLSDALRSPSLASCQNDQLDLDNFSLMVADKLAKSEITIKEKSLLDQGRDAVRSWSGEEKPLESHAQDPLALAFEAYERAGKTYRLRLSRAEQIETIVPELLEQNVKPSRKQWYNKAVGWLQEEDIRRIAYGKCVVDHQSAQDYKKLSSKKKKKVDQLVSKLKESRKPR